MVVLIVYVVFNQIDTKAIPVEQDQSSLPALTATDGFYLLCAMQEPESVDIYQEQTIKKYNKIFSTKFKIKDSKELINFTKNQKRIWKGSPQSAEQMKAINWPNDFRQDKCLHVLQHKDTLLQMKEEKKIFIERYERALASETFNDLSSLDHLDMKTIPLLHWLRMTKLYTSIQLAEALDGNWQQAVTNLIQQLDFAKRHNKSARLIITNLIFKAAAKIPLWAMASLMNQPNCPQEVYEQILQAMPDMTYEEFGTTSLENYEGIPGNRRYFQKRSYLLEISGFEKLFTRLLMQNNRTQRYYEDYFKYLISFEKTAPYKWFEEFKPKNPKKGILWWLQNPVGKSWASRHLKGSAKSNFAMVLKSYSLLTTYDMVRISADLHLHYNPDQSILENLKGLKTYQILLDPCSGKPYIWHEKKQILYSLGTDRDDDGGKGDPITSLDSDFVLPVVLYLNK